MQNKTLDTTLNVVASPTILSTRLQLLSIFLLGSFILYGIGFVQTPMAHNAAHDVRHSQGFPCH